MVGEVIREGGGAEGLEYGSHLLNIGLALMDDAAIALKKTNFAPIQVYTAFKPALYAAADALETVSNNYSLFDE